ncbi:MAG: helix-hairpin-helix domain-containing protein [Methylobacterium sp.]|nr:helix-hairpin-helix domain-containing protein [Methylobacterium sp.]
MIIQSVLAGTTALLLATSAFAQNAPQTPTQPQQRPATPAAPAAPAPAAPAPAARPATPAPAPAATAPAPAQRPAAAQMQLVNLNTATEAELDKLEQIGSARAKAIIEARTKGGRFKDWNDFVARNVVPKNAEEAIKNKVRF